jgi:protein TonB
VQRFNQRQGFLVSAILHLTILMILISTPPSARKPEDLNPQDLERKQVVFLPPAAELRRVLPPQLQPKPVPRPPAPAPTPPPPSKKDRISIGPPSPPNKKPLILHRDDDLTKVQKGQPLPPTPQPPAPTPTPAPAVAQNQKSATPETPGKEGGLRLPPGLGRELARGDEGSRARPGSLGPSIANAVDDVTRRVEREAQLGVPTGNGQNQAGFQFDPQGADFTLWINHLKNEVYRNWILPQSAMLGFRGHADLEFTVERDGTMSSVRLLKSSGTASLDRAAEYALRGSRPLPLPDDYGPPRLTIQVSFWYNEAPQGS